MNSTVLIAAGARGKVEGDLVVAAELGTALANAGYDILTGGGYGMMAAIAEAHRAAGGNAKGLSLESIAARRSPPASYPVALATTLFSRKQEMLRLCDRAVLLPGGVGSLDELFEMLCAKKLGHWDGTIVIFNHRSYYDSLLTQLEQCVFDGYLSGERSLYRVAATVQSVVKALSSGGIAWEDRDE
jgi:uncharacterized protein (TIGR00730 family)